MCFKGASWLAERSNALSSMGNLTKDATILIYNSNVLT